MKRRLTSLLLLLVVVYGVLTVVAGISLRQAVKSTAKVAEAAKAQDLDGIKKSIGNAKGDFSRTKVILIAFTPLRVIPVLGWYVADAQRGASAAVAGLSATQTLAEAVTPYADVLGLKGKGTFLGGTAQERLSSVVETLSKVTPQLDSVGKDLTVVRKNVDQIQSWRYPNFLPKKPGEKIDRAKSAIDEVETFITEARPLIEVLPEIMGQNKEKKYLILIQNDKELRPTGGFITAYAIFRVNKGSIQSEGSQDIYQLDATLKKQISAPDPIRKYLEVNSLHIRDSNLSPDFVSSMNLFQNLYASSSAKKEYDGIIAVDTQFVLNLIDVLGPIEALGQKFTADKVDACACPQIIYELEKYADEPVSYEKDDRKGIIGVLMQQIMSKTFEAPQSKWPDIISTMLSSLQQKNILLYFKDTKSQAAVEKVNFAGRIYEYNGDYLSINETNFGGAKSNLYIEEKVKMQVKKDNDQLNKKVTIEYKYPRKGDNCNLERSGGLCLAGTYRDWIRIYVPKGSKLIKSSGIEVLLTSSEELDKTVFEGFLTIAPEKTAKLEFEYTSPVKVGKEYKLLIQKQPGNPGHSYEIDAFGKKQKSFPLTQDKELIVKI
ncbi:MAG: DUF4012 domain-containing protein [Patescibacteria group bacterium]